MRGYKQPCQQGKGHNRTSSRPLDAAQLRDLALAYVARYATSASKLERYLARKLRERGWADGEDQPDLAALVSRYVELGYVDDEAYARMRGTSLLRRGYGQRRVAQSLAEAGIEADVRSAVAGSDGQLRQAALVLARKRRLGPFGRAVPDRETREKQVGVMLRAGHSMDMARKMVDAASIAAAEEWAAEWDGE
jgi:regulatory protein